MLEELSTSVRVHAFYTSSGEGKTGLTVLVYAWKPDGTLFVNGAAATERARGWYFYDLPANSLDIVGEYPVVFETADVTVDAKAIPAGWVIGRAGVERLAAIQAKTDLLGGSTVTVTSPFTTTGSLILEKGDSYLNAQGRGLLFTGEAGAWPNLTGLTVTFRLGTFSKVATVVTAGAGEQTVRVELTSAETAAFPTGARSGELEVAINGTEKATLTRFLVRVVTSL